MNELTKDKICIIGAGPSGLAAAAELKKRKLPFDIIDKGKRVGGMWDAEREDSPVYESAHFISSKSLSGYEGFPMPDHFPDYPNHQQILSYITDFAREHQLEKVPEFDSEVTKVLPQEGGKYWEITINQDEKRTYSGIIVANGRTWYKRMPVFQGEYKGESMHSFDYFSPEIFKGKKVLVVGGGNSACDIACDAAKNAKEAFISLRRGYYFIPKYVLGKPSDVFANEGPHLPGWMEKPIFEFLLNKIVVGKLENYGLPKPDHRIFESHPILNAHILHYLGHGDVSVKPDIVRFSEKEVTFKDGSREEIDLIIFATGYKQIFPYFRDEDLDLNAAGLPDLYLNLFSRRYENIFFIGFLETDAAAYPLFSQQSRLIARVLEKTMEGERLEKFHQLRTGSRPNLQKGTNYVNSPRHAFYVKNDLYSKQVKKVVKLLK